MRRNGAVCLMIAWGRIQDHLDSAERGMLMAIWSRRSSAWICRRRRLPPGCENEISVTQGTTDVTSSYDEDAIIGFERYRCDCVIFLRQDAYGARLSSLGVRNPPGCKRSQCLGKTSLAGSASAPCVAAIRSLRFRSPMFQEHSWLFP